MGAVAARAEFLLAWVFIKRSKILYALQNKPTA
uniref:Uncharacterized protein n=1 Tax=Anguilla anguilla TaxID=7936 RepID=A0A0E9UJD7_ANGAN